MTSSSGDVKHLWPDTVLEQDDSAVSSDPIDVSPPSLLKRAIFISDNELLIQGGFSAEIFALAENRLVHDIRFDGGLSQCVQLNERLLIFREAKTIWLWNLRARDIVFRWTSFPGAGQNSTTQIAVPRDGYGDRFFLTHRHKVYMVDVDESRGGAKVHARVVRSMHIPGWDHSDKKVCQMAVEGTKMALETECRMVLFDFDSCKLIYRFPFRRAPWFDIAENFCMNEKYLVYFDHKTNKIIVRNVDTAKIISRSPNLSELQYQSDDDTDPTDPFTFRSARFSIQQSILTTKLTSLKNREYRHIIIVSCVITGRVEFMQTAHGNFLWFTPCIHRKGMFFPDKDETRLIALPQSILECAFSEAETSNDWRKQFELCSWTLDELAEFELEKNKVEKLRSNSAAILLSAFVCRYDMENEEKFKGLSTALTECFRYHDIDGLVLSDRNVISTTDLADMIVDYLKGKYKELSKDLLLKGKIKAFINKFHTNN